MAVYTVGCVDSEDCGWEDDREYENIREAKEEVSCECCPDCGKDVRVI